VFFKTKDDKALESAFKEYSRITLACIKFHIDSVVSIGEILEGSDRQKALKLLAKRCDIQIAEIDSQISEVAKYKASLYENMVLGILKQNEYRYMKEVYNKDEMRLRDAKSLLQQEKINLLAGKSEHLRWMSHFKRYEDFTELDRRVVVRLIQRIRVNSKKDLEITFNYQDEYKNLLTLLERKVA